MGGRRAGTPAAVAGLLPAALAAVYAVAFATSLGRRTDARLFRRVGDTELDAVNQVGAHALRTIDIASLALAGTALVVVALVRGRSGRALAAAAVLLGALATSEGLKPVLGPLGEELAPARGSRWEGSFPSGHATIAMSLALAGVLVAPGVLRVPAAVAGAVYAGVVGVSLIALQWHYPSDVVGGYLVASFWCAAALAALRRWGEHAVPGGAGRHERLGLALGGLLAAGFVVLFGMTLATHPDFTHALRFRRSLLAAGAGLAAVSAALVALLTALARERAGR